MSKTFVLLWVGLLTASIAGASDGVIFPYDEADAFAIRMTNSSESTVVEVCQKSDLSKCLEGHTRIQNWKLQAALPKLRSRMSTLDPVDILLAIGAGGGAFVGTGAYVVTRMEGGILTYLSEGWILKSAGLGLAVSAGIGIWKFTEHKAMLDKVFALLLDVSNGKSGTASYDGDVLEFHKALNGILADFDQSYQ